jgi:hypothetical protein
MLSRERIRSTANGVVSLDGNSISEFVMRDIDNGFVSIARKNEERGEPKGYLPFKISCTTPKLTVISEDSFLLEQVIVLIGIKGTLR